MVAHAADLDSRPGSRHNCIGCSIRSLRVESAANACTHACSVRSRGGPSGCWRLGGRLIFGLATADATVNRIIPIAAFAGAAIMGAYPARRRRSNRSETRSMP